MVLFIIINEFIVIIITFKLLYHFLFILLFIGGFLIFGFIQHKGFLDRLRLRDVPVSSSSSSSSSLLELRLLSALASCNPAIDNVSDSSNDF